MKLQFSFLLPLLYTTHDEKRKIKIFLTDGTQSGYVCSISFKILLLLISAWMFLEKGSYEKDS